MDDTVHDIETSSSSEDSDCILTCSSISIPSQQSTSGSQSQIRQRRSLSLKKNHKENCHQSDACVNGITERKSRQSLFSSLGFPGTDSSTSINDNAESVECHPYNTIFTSKVTEPDENLSRSYESTTPDILHLCELNLPSQASHTSSIISSQHKEAGGGLQIVQEHRRLSHEKSQKGKKGHTEQQEGNSRGKRVRKSLFDALEDMSSSSSSDDVKTVAELASSSSQVKRPGNASNVRKTSKLFTDMSSSSSSDDVKTVTESALSSSQVQRPGNASNVRKTSKLFTDKPLQLAGSENQEPCSSSLEDTSSYIFESKNIFDSFFEEKKTLTDNVTKPELQNPAKISTFATKVVKETPKQKLHEEAIVIDADDSPGSSTTNYGNSNVRLSSNMQENKRRNIFAKFSHEKKNLTDSCNVGTPKPENQIKKVKSTTKVVKGTLKPNTPEDAIVIADSPGHNANSGNSNVRLSASVQEHTMHHEKKHKVSANDGANSPVIHQNRTLSTNVAEKQQNISRDFNSQKDNTSASSTSTLSAVLFERLKQNRPSIMKLLSSQMSVSLKQNSSKELKEDPLVISSDEEAEGRNESQQVKNCHRKESGLNNKTLGWKRNGSSKSTSLSPKQNPATNVKQSPKCEELIVANSLNSSDSCHSGILETFPALVVSTSNTSLSPEIPNQGEMHNQNRDSAIPSLITTSSHASITSMPSLQRKPSSIYRNSSFEECSPPLLSQYLIQSPTSLHQPEVVSPADSPSPKKNNVLKSASETSVQSSMFTECSDSFIDNTEDNLNEKLCNLIDMLDDDHHSVGTTRPGCSNDSKTDPQMQSCGLKSSNSSHFSISSESSTRQLNTGADLEVVKKEKSDSAVTDKEKSHCYSEIENDIYILDSDDEFLMSQSTQDIYCSNGQESMKSVNDGGEKSSNVNKMEGQALTVSTFDDEMAVNHLNLESKQTSLERTSGFRIDADLTVFEKGKDQNDLVAALAPQDPVVCANKQHCEPELSAATDFTVTVALYSAGRSQTSDVGLAVVKEEVDDNAFTGAADASLYSEIDDELYILDSDDDEFFMSQSVLSDHCADEPVNGAENQTLDIGLAVVKEEVNDNAFTGATDASMYSEINNELYILDSDDDEFFMSQSVLSDHCADKQEEVQNSTENKRLEMHEKYSHDLCEDECDDKVTYNKQLSENDNIFIKNKPGCSLADDVDLTGFEFDSDENDSNFGDLDKEATHLAPLPSDSSEDIDSGCSGVPNTGNNKNDLNEPRKVNIDDMTKITNDDDDDEYFFSQMDDVDEEYFAHTQIDYTIHSDDEFEDAEVKCKPLEHPQCVKNVSESSVSCEDVDTQDPFSVETQVCCPSVTCNQNQYDVETLPVSINVNEDAELQVNSEMQTTMKGLAKQNMCDKRTAAIYKTADHNLHAEQKRDVFLLLNVDTQDPFSLETQQNSDILMKEDRSNDHGVLTASPKFHLESVFTMETQECFLGDNHATDPCNKETLAISPSESENSESVFTMQTQVISNPEMNGENKKGRETIEDSSTTRESKQNIPGTEAMGRFKLARNDQLKNVSHCALLNNGDSQAQCDNSTQENNQLVTEDDAAYKGQTQVLSPGEELQSSYSIATQKYVQSESKNYQAAMELLNDDDTQEPFDLSTQNNDHLLLSEEDYSYEGQTQVFSPGKEEQDSYNIATQKYIQSEANCQHAAIAILNNDDDTQPHFDTSAQDNDQLQSEEDDAYGGQTQPFSLGKELQRSYDIATQKNFLSEENDRHLFDIQTLADATLLDDATQDLFDDEAQEQSQPASNDKYLYERQTLANSSQEESESESVYNMVTQRQFESEECDHSLRGREKVGILISVDDITHDPTKKGKKANQQTVLEDRCPYEQETQVSSASKEMSDLPTQKNFQLHRNNHTLRDNEMPTTSLDEDTQDPSDSETQAFHLASEGRYPCEREKFAAGEDEDCENLYSKATQKICQSEKYSPDPYNRETLPLSPTGSETMTHLLTTENEDSKSQHQCSAVGKKLSPSSVVDTQDPFEMETDVSSLEDQDKETFTASPLLTRNMESNFLTQLKTDVSQGIPNRETTAVSTCSHGDDDSSNDSECFFTIKTQKDSSSLVTDQNPYALQTQAVCSSFNEDMCGPFSVETLVDSPPGLNTVSPYDNKTLDMSVLSENSQDPFSMETQVDSSSFEEKSTVSKETAVATSSSCNKEAENNSVIEAQNNMSPARTMILHGKIDAAKLSEVDSGSRGRTCDLEIKAQDNSFQCTGQTFTLTPDPCGDSVLPSETTQHNIEENINCTPKKDNTVHHAQINAVSSGNQSLSITSVLHSIAKNKSPMASLIRKLSFNCSQKVHQPSKAFKDESDSGEQNFKSPYFVNYKQSSPTAKGANITESCCPSSSTKGALKLSVVPKQNCFLSEPRDFSQRPNMEDKAADKFIAPSESSSHSGIHKEDAASMQPDDYRPEEYVQINGANNVLYSIQEMLHRSDAKGLLAHDSSMAKVTSLSSHPLQQNLTPQHHKEKAVGLSESNHGSIKRRAEHHDETSSKRKCVAKRLDYDTEDSHGIAGRKRSIENKALDTILPDTKRLKVIPAENTWITARKGNISDTKHNKSAVATKNTSKLKRPRSKVENTTKGQLTCQVQSAKQMLQNRMMESRSVKPTNEQKTKSLTSDDNDDVAMPSTQEIMSLGLPIISAKLPVSKKHLAAGLPSQGRVASEDKELQDQNKDEPSGKLSVKGLPNRKNSIQKLPSVPLFDHLAACKSISSSAAGVVMPADSVITLENPASSVTSSTESKESCVGQSLMMSNCHTASGSESDKPITQTPTAVTLPVCSSSETSVAETAHTSSVTFTHANAAVSAHSGISAHSVPAQMSERVYSNGPSLPTLQGVLKQSAGTQSSHQGILKSNKPSELNHYGRKAESKVTFKDPPREHHSIQRREVTLPQACFSQPKESAKCKPEAKIYFLTTILHWNPMWLQEREKIQSLPALLGSRHKLEDVSQLRMYYSKFDEYVDITLKLLILECWETIYRDWKMGSSRSPVKLEFHCTCSPRPAYKEKEGQSLVCIDVTGLFTQQNKVNIPSVGDLLLIDFWGAKKSGKTHDKPRWCKQFAFVRSVGMQSLDMQFLQKHKIFESSPAKRDRNPVVVNMTLLLQFRGDIILPAKLHEIQVISPMKTVERQVDALVNLPDSPLCMQLLKPTQGTLFTYTNVQSNNYLSKLNQEQASSVATIVQEVKLNLTSQKMFLLQGPPGTGKSHTILALIHQLLIATSFKGRICLAAPSNAAVDEMAKRIIIFSQKLKQIAMAGISLVRVGNKNKVHQAVQPFMLEELVGKVLNKDIPESLKLELKALEKDALKLGRELSGGSLTQEQKVIKVRKQKEIQAKIYKLKADIAPAKKNGRERYKARCSVLDTAQVICGTLNSLGSEDLKEIVLRSEENAHKKFPFTCLIIDEATQAIEVDCLIPLQYKMTKVVLVGDLEQLPATVLSQIASEKQLTRSLFERMEFCTRPIDETRKSPVMMLKRQYRMHNEILNLPNSFFYDGQLVTDESVLSRKELLAPYLVFDIQESKESRDVTTRSVSNEGEAVCIAQLYEIVSKRSDKIGVICPYTDQQKLILECLQRRNQGGAPFNRNLAVEVNTVDSFQGQEREVIILSCVRAQSNPSGIGFLSDRKRMNVALTRAKLALYVIGNFDTLKTDELWEQLYKNAVNRNLLVKVHKTSDFKLLAENAVYRRNNYIANGS